jgi:hypothetical protein
MTDRCHAATAAQHVLIDHELPVVLPDSSRCGPESWIRQIRRSRPLPDVAVQRLSAARANRLQHVEIEEPAGDVFVRGRVFPLGLGREARAAPSCEGVGLVVADVTDRLRGIDRPHASQCEQRPTGTVGFPVQRRLPLVRLDSCPPVREPEVGARIPVVLDERQPVGTRRRAIGERERLQEHDVTRGLVVEREAATLVTDLDQAAGVVHPSGRCVIRRHRDRRGTIRGPQRVRCQHVLDVHEQELLVLLLVVETERHEIEHVRRQPIESLEHGGVDVTPVRGDRLDAGSGQQPALGTRMPRPDGLVVGVEQEPELGVELLMVRFGPSKDEGLEEPRRVRSVPFRRAHVRHRLDRLVLGRQWCSELLGQRAHRAEQRRECARGRWVLVVARRHDRSGGCHGHPSVMHAATQSWLRGGADHVWTLVVRRDTVTATGRYVTRMTPPGCATPRGNAEDAGSVAAYTPAPSSATQRHDRRVPTRRDARNRDIDASA